MQRQSRAEHSGLSVCPWSPVLWISGACGKAEAARIGFSCVLLCNSKWQHKSFLHYSLRIMLIHNGGNVTSSLFTYEAKTCHGSILTVGIVGEVECSHSQTWSHRAGAKRMCSVFPDISRYASIRPSFQELLRSPQKKKKRNSKMDDIINRSSGLSWCWVCYLDSSIYTHLSYKTTFPPAQWRDFSVWLSDKFLKGSCRTRKHSKENPFKNARCNLSCVSIPSILMHPCRVCDWCIPCDSFSGL